MKSIHIVGLLLMLLVAACGNTSEEKTAEGTDSSGAEFAGNSEENGSSLSNVDKVEVTDLFDTSESNFNDLLKEDTENSMNEMLTEETFKALLQSDDLSKAEIKDLLDAFKKKDSLNAQLIIAQKKGATKAELEQIMTEHKEILKQISEDSKQVEKLYALLDGKQNNNPSSTLEKKPLNRQQELVRDKLDLSEASYVEEKLTKFNISGEAKRKGTLSALQNASKAEGDTILATFFGITEPEAVLLKKLPVTPRIFSEDNAIEMRDYKVDAAIRNHLNSGKATANFKAQIQIFSEERAKQFENFLSKATRARQEFYKLNPGWYGQDQTSGITYLDSRNKFIYLPLGALSFADRIVSHDTGKADTGKNKNGALGIPDMSGDKSRDAHPNICNLGTAGVLTLEFLDNAIVNVNGPDLYVFELGAIEPTNLEISKDGITWINVGEIKGGTAFVDIEGFAKPGETYTYLRLTDLESPSALPGADVDAIAAIGGAVRLNIDSAVLFDTGEYSLKPSANAALNELIQSIEVFPAGTISIQGHTDNVGSPFSNQKLSLQRAEAVSGYISEKLSAKYKFNQVGYGETQPVAPNDTNENKQKNRRVEILVSPSN